MLQALGRISLVTTRSAEGSVQLLGRFRVGAPVADCRRCGGVSGTCRLITGVHRNGGVTLVASTKAPNVSSPKRSVIHVYCRRKVPIASLPNTTTYVATLAVSKLPAHQFTFRTFLPGSGGRRRTILRRLGARAHAVVVCRTPRRLIHALRRLSSALNKSHELAVYQRLAGQRRRGLRVALTSDLSCCRIGRPHKRCILVVTNHSHRRVGGRRRTK